MFGMALWHALPNSYQIWGAMSNYKECNVAAKEKRTCYEKRHKWCFYPKSGFEFKKAKPPQIWPTCMQQPEVISPCAHVCVCVRESVACMGECKPECDSRQLSHPRTSSSSQLQVPLHLKYCLLSFLSACLRWRPQGRYIFQGMYGYTCLFHTEIKKYIIFSSLFHVAPCSSLSPGFWRESLSFGDIVRRRCQPSLRCNGTTCRSACRAFSEKQNHLRKLAGFPLLSINLDPMTRIRLQTFLEAV